MKKLFPLFILLSFLSLANEYTLEDLEQMKKDNIISLEDYEILKNDLLGIKDEIFDYYSLKINHYSVSTDYKVINKNGTNFLDVSDFITLIGLENYNHDLKTKKLEIYLGETLKKVILYYDKNYIDFDNTIIKEDNLFEIIQNKIFLREDIFEKIFLNSLDIRKKDLKMSMFLSFTAPSDISKILDATKMKLENENNKNVLIFRERKELFDLGYLRARANISYTKNGFDWNADLAYQGSLLFGQFNTTYDIKNKRLGDLILDYPNIWNNHSLRIENRNNDGYRNFALNFFKDNGYYKSGEKLIIKESVPLGSRAELLYMGTPVDLQDEKNGFITFDNDNIKSDRNYELKLYTPDGKITIKPINTLTENNKQREKDIKYNISLVEHPKYNHNVTGSINLYYGITNKLTIGATLSKDLELYRSPVDKTDELKPRFVYSGNANLIFSSVLNGLSYSLKTGVNQVFNNEYDEQHRKLTEKNSFNYGIDLRYDKYRLNFAEEIFGNYYDKSLDRKIELKYEPFKNLRLGYTHSSTFMKKNNDPIMSNIFSLDIDYKLKNLLLNTSANIDLNTGTFSSYRLGAYYTGLQNTTLRFENIWTNNFKDYEAKFTLYNNNYRGLFDFLFEASYNSNNKAVLSFRVSMKLDNFVNIDANYLSSGYFGINAGIDKIIDLRNPLNKINNLDVSRAEVLAFVDENNNDIFDKGEKQLENVEVEIGNTKKTTSNDGKVMFYGLTNNLEHKLNVKIKKPNYILTAKEIKILSKATSTVKAYIPIKPMIDLSGSVNFDEELNLTETEKQEFYSDVLIEIKDKNGKTLELVAPDNTGHFDVSGLFPEEYIIEISYLGLKYNIPSLKKNLLLTYNHGDNSLNNFNHNISVKFSEKEIELLSRK